MASDQEPDGLEPDELVRRLVPDPSQAPPEVMVLTGWVGESVREGYLRLYLAADLAEYVEFQSDDVVHHERLPAEQASVGGTLVWLRRTAELQYTRPVRREAQAAFLRGDVTAMFLPRVQVGGGFGRPIGGGAGLVSVPPQASVCFSCPTSGGEHTCVPATCTLATSCST